jgi:hypothetical protein
LCQFSFYFFCYFVFFWHMRYCNAN